MKELAKEMKNREKALENKLASHGKELENKLENRVTELEKDLTLLKDVGRWIRLTRLMCLHVVITVDPSLNSQPVQYIP